MATLDYSRGNTVFYSTDIREDLKYVKTISVWGFK
jgi:hypothetical protein